MFFQNYSIQCYIAESSNLCLFHYLCYFLWEQLLVSVSFAILLIRGTELITLMFFYQVVKLVTTARDSNFKPLSIWIQQFWWITKYYNRSGQGLLWNWSYKLNRLILNSYMSESALVERRISICHICNAATYAS